MSYVIAAPEMMAAAAGDLATIGSDLSAAHTAAAAQTTGVLAAAEDEVSAAIAALFSAHGQGFQALGAQAAAFHDQFVQALNASAGSYASAEAANVAAGEHARQRYLRVTGHSRRSRQRGNPTFTGTPSLVTRFEKAALGPVKGFLTLPGVDNQLASQVPRV